MKEVYVTKLMRTESADLRGKIRRLCGYIADDRWIASYIGVSVGLVRAERAKLRPKAFAIGTPRKAWDGEITQAHDGTRIAKEEAERGSRKLLEAYARYFERHVQGRAA